MAWIKVHAGTQRKKYWFNTDTLIHITEYEPKFPSNNGHQSTLSFEVSGEQGPWTLAVQESPEEIIEMISAATALADRMTSP